MTYTHPKEKEKLCMFILFFKFLIAGMVVHRHRGKKQKSVSLDMRKERLIESVSKALYCMDMAQ